MYERVYDPFGGVRVSADPPTTTYKKHRDLQHALQYDKAVSADANIKEYVRSRDAAVLEYLEKNHEMSHTFRVRCELPGDEQRSGSGIKNKLAFHPTHYIKFSRVPDIRQSYFVTNGRPASIKELLGYDYDDLDKHGLLAEKIHLKESFEKMLESGKTDAQINFPYVVINEETKQPIMQKTKDAHGNEIEEPMIRTAQLHIGYNVVIENADPPEKRKAVMEMREEERKLEEIERNEAEKAGKIYDKDYLTEGITRLDKVSPIYEDTNQEGNPKHSAEEINNWTDKDRHLEDTKILRLKNEMYSRLDHTGEFSDNQKIVATKDQIKEFGRNAGYETRRTLVNTAIRYPIQTAREGASFLDRLLGKLASVARYR